MELHVMIFQSSSPSKTKKSKWGGGSRGEVFKILIECIVLQNEFMYQVSSILEIESVLASRPKI